MEKCQQNNELPMSASKKIDSIIGHAERHCKLHGSRLTIKRKQILWGLIKSEKALSAYELTNVCTQEFGEAIHSMSVYRILQFLEGENLVHKLNLVNKYVACAHISCDHAHSISQFLICGSCNKVEEISVPKKIIDTLQQKVVQAGFRLTSPQLEMNCVCNDCSAQ